jgi:hypothetical protein
MPMSDLEDSDVLAETENMIIWRSQEADVGYLVHVELGGVTLHLLPDEWEEFLVLLKNVK